MKRAIYMILGLAALTAMSCNEKPEVNYEGLFPEEYHKVVYFKESGKDEFDVFTNAICVKDFTICKAGSDPALTADCRLEVMTQERLDSLYSIPEATAYKLLPESTYTISETSFPFASGETWKTGRVTFHPKAMVEIFADKPDSLVYALPLEVVALDETTVVNSSKNVIFYRISSLSELVLSFTAQSQSLLVSEDIVYFDVAAKLENVDVIPMDLTCKVVYSADAEDLLAQYNDTSAVDYALIPKEALLMPEKLLTYVEGESVVTDNVEVGIVKSAVDKAYSYFLPLELSECSDSNIVLGRNQTVLVELALDQIPLTADMFSSTHGQAVRPDTYKGHDGNLTSTDNCGQKNNDFANLLDGKRTTFWSSWRQYVGEPSARTWPSDDPAVTTPPGYWFDVDLGQELRKFYISYSTTKNQYELDNSCPRGIFIDVNGGEYTEWTTVARLLDDVDGLPLELDKDFVSEVYVADKSFTKLRFRVDKSKYDVRDGKVRVATPGCFQANQDLWFNNPSASRATYNMAYFSISEFGLYGI